MEPAAAQTSTSAGVTVPETVGKTLDKAKKDLEEAGFKVVATDTVEGKTIILKSNWEVISQEPAGGTTAPERSTVQLGVKHLTTNSKPSPTPSTSTVPATVTGGGSAAVTDPVPAVPDPVPAVPNPVPVAPNPVPQVPDPGPKVGGTIICKDGYVWPSTTRQGACHGHKGIAN
ncbi:PASTA domain-containing protein [Paenarthrobacter sp. UW852]|uniref:PASTA domain-containing protein n=1 Tax=Paenarthrobacter sp. UW852 TaxID=2951989 RepID=UPI0021497443|nr:PASTA domain-containing protein [Paenarthrobacter sp. UW852]